MFDRISKQDALDIITTALEGGIGYWSKCEPLERDDDLNYLRTRIYVPAEELADEQYVEGGERYVDEGNPFFPERIEYAEVGVVTTTTIRDGIRRILSGEVKVCDDFVKHLKRAEDAGDLDASDADVILQAGLLGEVVYG